MEKFRPRACMFEPATYRIGVMGTLDEKWSAYCAGMAIEHDIVLDHYPITILRGLLVDQAALVGVINTLYDMGCPIVLVECVQNGVSSDDFRSAG